MFDWLGDFISSIGDAIGSAFSSLGKQISNAIWDAMLKWFYETIYNAVADFFTGERSRVLTPGNEKIRLLEEAGISYEVSMEKAALKAVELCNELKAEGK